VWLFFPVKCSKCGYNNSNLDKFCLDCGVILSGPASRATKPPGKGLKNYTVIKLIKSDPASSDFFVSDRTMHLGVETLEGVDLETILEKEGKPGLPEEKVLEWTKDILEILKYLHEEKPPIIYQYIKPYNIILHEGKARLKDLDFVKTEEEKKLTGKRPTEIAGYAPLEQIQGNPEPRSDLYSLGATIYHLLTGITPKSTRFDPLRKIIPSVSNETEKLVLKATKEKTSERYYSARDMRKTIEKIKTEATEKPHELYRANPTDLLPPPYSVTGRSKLTFALVLSLTIILMFIGWYGSYRLSPSEQEDSDGNYNEAYWNDRGVEFYKRGEYATAIDYYDKAIEINPGYKYPWYNKSVAFDALRKYEEAIECADKAIEIDPDYGQPWYSKGNCYDSLGKYEEALKCYDKALAIDPLFTGAWNNKASVLIELEKYEEATGCCNKAVELDPSYTYGWYNLGICLEELGNYKEALSAYDKALETDPSYGPAEKRKKGLLDRVDQEYDRDYWNDKGIEAAHKGEHKKAIDFYDKAIEIDSDYELPWYNKGISYDELGKYEEALKV